MSLEKEPTINDLMAQIKATGFIVNKVYSGIKISSPN
jgi:hypothetical protein